MQTYIDDPTKLTDIESYITEQTEALTTQLDSVSLSEVSTEELLALLSFAFEKFSNASYIAAVLRVVDLAVQHYFDVTLPIDTPKAEIIRYTGIPNTHSYSAKEELALLTLAQEVQEGSLSVDEIDKRLHEIEDTYCWYVCGYYNEQARSLEYYRTSFDALCLGDPERRIREIEQRAVTEHTLREQVLKPLIPEQRVVADMTAYSTYLKDYYKYMSNKIIYSLEPLFAEIATRTNTTIEYIKELDDNEVSELLQGTHLDSRYLAERARHNTMLAFDGHFDMHVGDEADQFEKNYLVLQTDAKVFTGRVASKGHARGVARIVRSSNEFNKLQQGDVLVVINTTPDYVPILKLACAIVAEEGGVTAHVSVVSREFGLPAVVGLPRITEIIKDGDIVDVDAEKGIVTLL
jgi:phosphohistidine swiveling domain-containing protein